MPWYFKNSIDFLNVYYNINCMATLLYFEKDKGCHQYQYPGEAL
jgi:hypothetical protein